MSASLSNLSRRLAKVERHLREKAWREKLAHCNCKDVMVADSDHPEKFEAEMNLPCPAHGFRRFAVLIAIHAVGGNGEPGEDTSRFDELIATYHERKAWHASQESKHDSQEP